MTGDPDVTPVGFAATDGPGALVRRRRNPGWLVAALLLAGLGIAGVAWFVVAQARSAASRDDAVAAGRVAALGGTAAPVRFTGPGRHTVWVELDGVLRTGTRETIVAATTCEAAFGRGGSAALRGARQGASVTIGDRSTVGTFAAPAGEVVLRCRQEPFGRLGRRAVLDEERPFFVTPGTAGAGWPAWTGLVGGIGLLLLAVPVLSRFTSGHLRPRRAAG